MAFSLLYIRKVRRVPLYMTCLFLCCVGQSILAAHFIFNLDGSFNRYSALPITRHGYIIGDSFLCVLGKLEFTKELKTQVIVITNKAC